MKIIKKFKNNELLTFADDNYPNLIKIYIDDNNDNYDEFNIKKGYKMNLIASNKGSYKGSFMNNYICKKFRSNQKLNVVNIETNKILNYCKYFLLSINEYINYFPQNLAYQCYWFLRTSDYNNLYNFIRISYAGHFNYSSRASISNGFVPFFIRKKTITPTLKIPTNFEIFQTYIKFLKNIFGFIVDRVIKNENNKNF